MTSFILFACGCLLCAIFLATLYGDSLPLLDLFEGRWLVSLLSFLGRSFTGFAGVFELGLQFLLNNLMWVLATSAGAVGLTMVLALISSGLALDAAEYQRDIQAPVRSGGVLDTVADLQEQRKYNSVPATLTSLSRRDRDESLLLVSSWSSGYRLFNPAWDMSESRSRRPPLWPLPADFTDFPQSRPAGRRPVLDVRFRRLDSRDDDGQYSVFGELIETFPDEDFVARAVERIVRGAWRQALAGYRNSPNSESGTFNEELAESSASELRRLEQSVRVIPGAGVAEQELQVEKLVPTEVEGDLVEIRIRLTNVGRQTINGLLVREALPAGTRIREAFPEPAFRDATLTWLLDGFRPGEERILQFTAIPALEATFPKGSFRDLLFESDTEVSAVLAVASPVEVLDDLGSATSPIRTPPLTSRGTADVRMTLDEAEQQGTVGNLTRFFFEVSNEGTATSAALQLRVTLDDQLEHVQLQNSNDRQLFVSIRPLQPAESRRYRLEVRPTLAGLAVNTAELLDGDSQLALEVFRVNSSEPAAPTTP